MWVLKVVMYLEPLSNSCWWYPERRSNLLKTLAPLRSLTSSFSVGVWWRSRWIALLAARISTHSLFQPGSFFGGVTIGNTQGVGTPSTLSTISLLGKLFNSYSTFGLRWNGVRRRRWATGLIVSSMYILTVLSFIFPMPLNKPGCSMVRSVIALTTWMRFRSLAAE